MSANDRAIVFGDGAYETMRSYAGRFFRFPEHLRRLRFTLEGQACIFELRGIEFLGKCNRLDGDLAVDCRITAEIHGCHGPAPEYAIDRFTMETKRQLDLLDKQLEANQFLAGADYSIADMATWPWYGAVALGRMYDAGEFLQVESYEHVQRWAKEIDARPAVKRGRRVNRTAFTSSPFPGRPRWPIPTA